MRSPILRVSRLALIGAAIVVAALTFQAADEPDGASIFKQRCSMCHGPDGKGFPALKTPDFTDPKWQESVKDSEITETIKNGKKGTPMPPFGDKLSDEEIKAVVAHIRSLNSNKK